jgi:murein DD-endopeptidase MepM/ murein hydrolase activator NlpD
MTNVVNSDDLREWIDENEREENAPPPVPPPQDEFRLIWPTPEPKIITQWYGINPQWYSPFGLPGHEGLDMRSLNGTPIYAMAAGEVIRVETNPNNGPYGIHVRLKHSIEARCRGEGISNGLRPFPNAICGRGRQGECRRHGWTFR